MRRLLVALTVPTLMLAFTPRAVAGGSLLEIRHVDGAGAPNAGPWGGWAGPGATVTMRGTLGSGAGASVSAGPWSAYLRAESGGERIPLGPVHIAPATGGFGTHVATVSFTVPAVPSGGYWVDVCADPRCEINVGDLAGGFFTVATTDAEVRLLGEVTTLRADLLAAQKDEHRLRERVASLELTRSDAARRSAERSAREELATADSLSKVRDQLASELASAISRANRWRALAVGSLVLLGTGTIAAVLWMRRRRPRVLVPDTPESLIDASEPTPTTRDRA